MLEMTSVRSSWGNDNQVLLVPCLHLWEGGAYVNQGCVPSKSKQAELGSWSRKGKGTLQDQILSQVTL